MSPKPTLMLAGALLVSAPTAAPADERRELPAKQLTIDAGKPDAAEKWSEAAALLGRCEPLELQLWYAFGSLALSASPQAKTCNVELSSEIEMDKKAISCALPAGTRWTWNLVSDGKRARQSPPRDWPAEWASYCKKR